jgi:hypothetical protein
MNPPDGAGASQKVEKKAHDRQHTARRGALVMRIDCCIVGYGKRIDS